MGGAVVDFIDFQWWPVFNVADIAIVCGAIAVAYSMFVSQPDVFEGTE
jgi:signal peptidase II